MKEAGIGSNHTQINTDFFPYSRSIRNIQSILYERTREISKTMKHHLFCNYHSLFSLAICLLQLFLPLFSLFFYFFLLLLYFFPSSKK